MSLQLFGHPFSSCTMKALIALYENETAFRLPNTRSRAILSRLAEGEATVSDIAWPFNISLGQ
jgi:hypothetical protein